MPDFFAPYQDAFQQLYDTKKYNIELERQRQLDAFRQAQVEDEMRIRGGDFQIRQDDYRRLIEAENAKRQEEMAIMQAVKAAQAQQGVPPTLARPGMTPQGMYDRQVNDAVQTPQGYGTALKLRDSMFPPVDPMANKRVVGNNIYDAQANTFISPPDTNEKNPNEWAIRRAAAAGDKQAQAVLDGLLREKRAGAGSGSNEYKVPSGYQVAPDGSLVPWKGGPAEKQTMESAAKEAMLLQARDNWAAAKEKIVNEDGSINREIIATMAVAMPFSEGRTLRTLVLDSVEARLRAESGAAVPEAEVKRAAARFIPSPLDNDKTIKQKMTQFEAYLGTAIDVSGKGRRPDNGKGKPAKTMNRDEAYKRAEQMEAEGKSEAEINAYLDEVL